jgi:hypothetical protein
MILRHVMAKVLLVLLRFQAFRLGRRVIRTSQRVDRLKASPVFAKFANVKGAMPAIRARVSTLMAEAGATKGGMSRGKRNYFSSAVVYS